MLCCPFIPEVIREINTYYLGAKSVNPKVDIDVIWVNTWYDPKGSKCPKVMIAEGCDMVAQHTDSVAPITDPAEKAGVFGFGQASDQFRFAPKGTVNCDY